MKIIHSADWHVRDKDIEEIEDCLNKLHDVAFEEDPDFVVIAGDLFDSQDVKLDSQSAKLVIRTVSDLAKISAVMVVIGTPSHDGKAPEILSEVNGSYPVYVASQPRQMVTSLGVFTLIPQPTKQFLQVSDQEISETMSGIFAGFGAKAADYPDRPHILVGHWTTTGAALSTGQVMTGRDIEISLDQMALAKADLNFLGHIHKAQKLGDRTFYAGSLYATNWGEAETKGFWIHEIEAGSETRSRFIETPTRKLVRHEIDLTAGGAFEDIDFALIGQDTRGAFVRCDIRVWQDEAEKVDQAKIRAFLSETKEVDIRLIRIPRVMVRADKVLKADRLRDKIQAMAAIQEGTVPEEIMLKADMLEDLPGDKLIEGVTA